MNKKGSLMTEAAIVYPLVIGAMMSLIYIIICMYSASAIKANIHLELRKEAQSRMETGEVLTSYNPYDKYGRKAFGQQIYITEKKQNNRAMLYGSVNYDYRGNSMMGSGIRRTHQDAVYLIDERDYIRKVDMVLQ